MSRAKKEIKKLGLKDKNYPNLLKEIFDPPKHLYVLGELKSKELALAVVGTRKATDYGREITFDIVSELANAGLTIVSGLALGIDSFAHEAALRVKGRTIAVLACGLDRFYPHTNERLGESILKSGGAVISEYPAGTPPYRAQFPQRNRLISGLSLGTLVIEAGQKSGALITAFSALDQNREVFAIPGNVYNPASRGTNYLIKKGAHLVTSAEEILEILQLNNLFVPKHQAAIAQNKEEEIIISCLKKESYPVDQLIKESQLSPAQVNATLTTLELKGLVKNLGGEYVLKSKT